MATLENFNSANLYTTSYDYSKVQGVDGAKPRSYEGTMLLISGITQKNGQTFPLVHAADIQLGQNDTERVTDKFIFIDNVLRDIYGIAPSTLEGYKLESLAKIAATLNNDDTPINTRITNLRAFKTVAVTSTSTAIADLATDGSASAVADSNADIVTLAAANKWIKLKGTASNDTISFGHLVQTISDDAGTTDYNTATSAFAVDTFTYDEAGHIRSKHRETYTLPMGYKTVQLLAPVTTTATVPNNTATTSVTATTLVDTIKFGVGNKWLVSAVNVSTKTITFGHIKLHEAAVGDITANQTPNFGATFTVPNLAYDEAGHITSSSTHTVKIPQPSISTAANNSGNVLVNLTLTATTGALVRTYANIGTLALTGYSNNATNSAVVASDTLNTALSKLEKQIAAETTARTSALSTETTARADADTALQNAINLLNGTASTQGSVAYAVAQEAAQRQAADSSVASNAASVAASRAATAETNAKAYADTQAEAAETNAKVYADTQASTAEENAKTYANTQASGALATAKSYTNTQIGTLADGVATVATAIANALTSAQTYADTCEANANDYTDTAIAALNTNWSTNSATAAARAAIKAVDDKFADYTKTDDLVTTLQLSTYAKSATLTSSYMTRAAITNAIADAISDLKANYSLSLNAPSVELSLRQGTADTLVITVSGPGVTSNEVTANLYKDDILLVSNVGSSYQANEDGDYYVKAVRAHNGDTVEAQSNTITIRLNEE